MSVLEKVVKTLQIVMPVVIMIFAGLNMARVVEGIEKWTPIVYEALAALTLALQVWGVGLSNARHKRELKTYAGYSSTR